MVKLWLSPEILGSAGDLRMLSSCLSTPRCAWPLGSALGRMEWLKSSVGEAVLLILLSFCLGGVQSSLPLCYFGTKTSSWSYRWTSKVLKPVLFWPFIPEALCLALICVFICGVRFKHCQMMLQWKKVYQALRFEADHTFASLVLPTFNGKEVCVW